MKMIKAEGRVWPGIYIKEYRPYPLQHHLTQKTWGPPPPKGTLQLKPRNLCVQSGTTNTCYIGKEGNYGSQGNPYHCFPQGLTYICLCRISIVHIVTEVASFWKDSVN